MKFRFRDMKGKWFDFSPIMKRNDPRYIRKQYALFLFREAKYYAPIVFEGAMATLSTFGLMLMNMLAMIMAQSFIR